MMEDHVSPERRVHMRRALSRRAHDPKAFDRRGALPLPPGTPQALLLDALVAVRAGDFSVRLPYSWIDIDGKIADAFNEIAIIHGKLAAAVERVSSAVGDEGKLGQRLAIDRTDGAWGEEVDAINSMIDNLVQPVREVGRVIGAVARGDLSESMQLEIEGRPLRGEFLKNANTINTMLEQLNSFADEVARVAREVGTEGTLGGQARVEGASGVWRDLTDNVNLMASNLTGQVRNIAEVTTAVAQGDLSRKITADVKGEILRLKETINLMVDQLNRFAGEVTRVAREVGTEGKLGGQADVKGVSGVWKDLTESVNLMANNLTGQVRNIADVTTAVASGDLSRKITVDVKGEILRLKETINLMVDQLNSFAGEVTRVAREVGTDGKLGGQADVKGVAGVWKDLTDNVNLMASNLTGQVRNIAEVTTAVARGDLSRKITVGVRGEILQLKDTVNIMVDQLNSFAGEVTRVAREVGTEGKLGGQAEVKDVAGVWKDLTDSVNAMASNVTGQVRNIAEVTTAVANGDLSRKITVDVRGEILELKNTINIMVDQLNAFGGEVTRVAREVGTEGKLGGQAQVKGVSGVWKELTDSVNLMAANLTDQVRGMAKVVTGVAVGNLKQKMVVPAKGEVAALADTINDMVDTLAIFSDQVTRVAREVGVEGRLGGQAVVPGASGSWRDLVDNVNELAANLSTQVRAIGEVATAVTKGDLGRTIQVAARGEVADLKDNVNQMIRNLRETTETNTEQDWLKTNLARLNRMLQGQRDIMAVSRLLLSELAPLVSAQHAVLYLMQGQLENALPGAVARLTLMASYGYRERKGLSKEWRVGEGLVGQAAFEQQRLLIRNVPDDYIQIVSGLGQGAPSNIVVLPILFEDEVKAVIELAAFEPFQAIHLNFLDQLSESLGIVFNSIETASGTEMLLRQQAQKLEGEFTSQQARLQETNAELERKAHQLSDQNIEVERKNREIEEARKSLQEKAEQLSLTSRYKSEFLANMSHELRSPLNSLLLLAEQLRQNRDQNLSEKQLEMVKVMHASGRDLLHVINDILDLSKIEAGSATLDIDEVVPSVLTGELDKSFRAQFEAKGLAFRIDLAPDLPARLRTDVQRVKQLLTNLLSNALKFTSRGSVMVSVKIAARGWNRDKPALEGAARVVAFSVTDTGIGIPQEKRRMIFEAFQQADSSTSRRYGGTGLGLAISSEIARLLDGELAVESEPGVGSTFTLYLPQQGGSASETPAQHAAPAGANGAAHHVPARLLIIEDNLVFARTLQDLARERGFSTLLAASIEEGLALARRERPDAITLDLELPDGDGWDVADLLKADPATAGIPIHVISVLDRPRRAARHGVASYTTKPADLDTLAQVFNGLVADAAPPIRVLLLVGSDLARRDAITRVLAQPGRDFDAVASGAEALEALHQRAYQGIVIELDLPGEDGVALLRTIRGDPNVPRIPAVVVADHVLDPHVVAEVARLDAAVVGDGAQVLVGQTDALARFLQQVGSSAALAAASLLEGRRVLIVDDDVRNLFALTGLLENAGMEVLAVESGAEALRQLGAGAGIDIVLMDMMMPEMDGYETMRRIRADARLARLPIIALTANAMLQDRSRCLAAGASDYASKPVDTGLLLAQLRMWLAQPPGA
jgi:signal transduction histidine kinase/HAMP domain-containing protein/DNA-binding response OmpR family regulator